MHFFLSIAACVAASAAFAQEADAPAGAETGEAERLIEINPEQDFWDLVNEDRSPAAMRRYLNAYPDGAYRGLAEARIEAEDTEAALKLRAGTRREVQEMLLLMGFEPRGRDGVFGPGARNAIAEWQLSAGRFDTGFSMRTRLRR